MQSPHLSSAETGAGSCAAVPAAVPGAAGPGAPVPDTGRLEPLVEHLRLRLLEDHYRDRLAAVPHAQLRETMTRMTAALIAGEHPDLTGAERDYLIGRVLAEMLGYGPLEPLLADPEVTEIAVNGPEEVYAERDGHLYLTGVRFRDADHIRRVIDRIVAPTGRRIDESSPMVDARLPDGSRVNAVIPPVSLCGPVLTIRKFRRVPFTLAELVSRATLSPEMAAFLRAAVEARRNILISGGTGSGKSSLLAALAGCIPAGERLVVIEDLAELRLNRRGVLHMEGRPANVEGKGEITIRQLVRNALRMRPDRIIVGEVRGDEALDMLQAMNSGHAGSMTTIHANGPADALRRLEAMVSMANPSLTGPVIREHVVSAVELVVQAGRLPDGSRRVLSIAEVRGTEGGKLQVAEVYRLTGK